jgi:hypothetical protein
MSVSSISFLSFPTIARRASRTLKTLDLGFQFPDSIFGSSKLREEPMRHGHCLTDAFFRIVRRLLEQLDQRVLSLIDESKLASWLQSKLVTLRRTSGGQLRSSPAPRPRPSLWS